jgi:hypothetical protein
LQCTQKLGTPINTLTVMRINKNRCTRLLHAGYLTLAIFFYACSTGTPLPTDKPIATPLSTRIDIPTKTQTTVFEFKPTHTLIPTEKISTPETSTPTIELIRENMNINPLTGLEVENPDKLQRRPIAVKVQLFPRGQRPPWGISLADIVYDYYQNNGVTRLTAIFYGQDAETVGPIRSARLFDLNIIKMYKSVFIFGLADWRIYQKLLKSSVSDRLVVEKYGSCPPLCRIKPESYNHLVVNTAALSDYLDEIGISNHKQNLDGMVFSDQPPDSGIPADEISIRISYSAYNRWDFNSETGKFLRYQDIREGNPEEEAYDPLFDQLTGEQISASNVVILFLGHKYAYQTEAGKNEVFDIRFTGEGEAVAFRDGFLYQLYWKRTDTDAPLILTFPDGTDYPYKPGNTWYQLVGKSSVIENQKDNRWRFEFKVP